MRWAVIAVGFVGVLLIVQPRSEGFNGYSLVCLLSAFFVACRDLYTRRINADTPSILITIGTAIAVTTASTLLSVFQDWKAGDGAATGNAGGCIGIPEQRLHAADPRDARWRCAGDSAVPLLGAAGRVDHWLRGVGRDPECAGMGGHYLLVAAGLYGGLRARTGARTLLETAPE